MPTALGATHRRLNKASTKDLVRVVYRDDAWHTHVLRCELKGVENISLVGFGDDGTNDDGERPGFRIGR